MAEWAPNAAAGKRGRPPSFAALAAAVVPAGPSAWQPRPSPSVESWTVEAREWRRDRERWRAFVTAIRAAGGNPP